MTVLSERIRDEQFRLSLHYHHFRLTAEDAGFDVLAGLWMLSLYLGQTDTGSIPFDCLKAEIRYLQETESRVLVRPPRTELSDVQITNELDDLDARGVISCEWEGDRLLSVDLLIDKWPDLPSVRKGGDGQPMRREW